MSSDLAETFAEEPVTVGYSTLLPLHGGAYGPEIKYDFSTNVCPFPCPDRVRETLIRALDRLDRYPDLEQRAFREAVARLEGVDSSCVLGGSGASELISGIARAITPGRALVLAPSFSGYERALKAVGCEVERLYLEPEDNFTVGEELLDCISERYDAVFLSDPNNPTGVNLDPDLLEEALLNCEAMGISLVVDESFLRTSNKRIGLARRVADYSYLYVVSSFTKCFALPGLRIGYCVSQPNNLAALRAQLPEWNMSSLAQDAGVVCAEIAADERFWIDANLKFAQEIEYMRRSLENAGVRVFETDSNFMLVYSDEDLYHKALAKGMAIRDCSNFYGLGQGYCRIAAKGTAANGALIDALTEGTGAN